MTNATREAGPGKLSVFRHPASLALIDDLEGTGFVQDLAIGGYTEQSRVGFANHDVGQLVDALTGARITGFPQNKLVDFPREPAFVNVRHREGIIAAPRGHQRGASIPLSKHALDPLRTEGLLRDVLATARVSSNAHRFAVAFH